MPARMVGRFATEHFCAQIGDNGAAHDVFASTTDFVRHS